MNSNVKFIFCVDTTDCEEALIIISGEKCRLRKRAIGIQLSIKHRKKKRLKRRDMWTKCTFITTSRSLSASTPRSKEATIS